VATVPNKLPLLVRLPDGELEDIGTTFSVTVEEGRTARVAVEEGRVVLRLHGRAPVVIAAGESWPAPSVTLSAPAPSLPGPAAAPATERAPTGLEPATPHEPPASVRKPSRARASASPATAPSAASNDFREAMAALRTGRSRDAAARFARFIERHPRDARAEDAAYLRVFALREAGDDAGMKAAARQYLGHHPQGFRRAEVEALLR
jgi:TolA-binding protein